MLTTATDRGWKIEPDDYLFYKMKGSDDEK